MTNDQIKHMVDRFLSWKLPDNFNPDGGVSFKAEFNENTPWPMRHEPSGTNLLDYTQAEAMVRHMLEGLPDAAEARTVGGAGEALGRQGRMTIEKKDNGGYSLVIGFDTRGDAFAAMGEVLDITDQCKAGKEARQ